MEGWMHTRLARIAILALALVGTLAWSGTAAAQTRPGGAVYVLTNAADGNAVAVFDRAGDGTLTPAGTVPTGGTGTGAGLGSQGALVLSRNGHWLFAVNAGSNDISVFKLSRNGLHLRDRQPSGGVMPISLTVHDGLLYVLNAGDGATPGNISGFTLEERGRLAPLAGSTRPLSAANVGPAQVEFSRDGDVLVVTEKATNQISTYMVDDDGLADGPHVQPSAGQTPFGFAFGKRGQLFVSEAFGGAPNASAVSSYDVDGEGILTTITPSAATHQTAACWVVVTRNGRYVYTSNTGSGSITGYHVARDGSLTLLNADGRTGVTGDGSLPTDMDLSRNSQYLYALNSGTGSVAAFAVGGDGSLTHLGNVGALAPGAVGLAAW
jgi:6-phosphogluconolactonase (cycloisomerase 2 family)